MTEHATIGQGTTSIEWASETWNPVTGCDRVSPGCAHCYALTLAKRLKAMGQEKYQRDGDPKTSGPGFGVTLHPDALEIPLRWRRPRVVFVNSMSDLFHEEIPYEFVREVFNVMRRCDGGVIAATGKRDPSHVFQVLTKRPERALELWRDRKLGFTHWPKHVWLGVSIENARYTWRADVLREISAAVRFISAEPLLGSLFEEPRITRKLGWDDGDGDPIRSGHRPLDLTGIDWLIVGGESGGRSARPMHPEWARELREACLDVCGTCLSHEGVQPNCSLRPALFFKQWGSWSPERPEGFGGLANAERGRRIRSFEPDGTPYDGRGNDSWQRSTTVYYHGAGPKSGGRMLDGREWNEMPARQAVEA